jgi:hypothetical protein
MLFNKNIIYMLLIVLIIIVYIKQRCNKYNRHSPFNIEQFANIELKNTELEQSNKLIEQTIINNKKLKSNLENINKYYINILIEKILDLQTINDNLKTQNLNINECDATCQIKNLNLIKNNELEIERLNKIVDDIVIENKDIFIKNQVECINKNNSSNANNDTNKQCIEIPEGIALLNEKGIVNYIKILESKIKQVSPKVNEFICRQCNIQDKESESDEDLFVYVEGEELKTFKNIDDSTCIQSCSEIKQIENEITDQEWELKQELLDKQLQYMKEHQSQEDKKYDGIPSKTLNKLFNPSFENENENETVLTEAELKDIQSKLATQENILRTYYIFILQQYIHTKKLKLATYNNIKNKNQKQIDILLAINKKETCKIKCVTKNLKKIDTLNKNTKLYGDPKTNNKIKNEIKKIEKLILLINIDNRVIVINNIIKCLNNNVNIKQCILIPENKYIKDIIQLTELQFIEFLETKFSKNIGILNDTKILSKINYDEDSYNITGISQKENISDMYVIPELTEFYNIAVNNKQEPVGYFNSKEPISPLNNNIYKTQYYNFN